MEKYKDFPTHENTVNVGAILKSFEFSVFLDLINNTKKVMRKKQSMGKFFEVLYHYVNMDHMTKEKLELLIKVETVKSHRIGRSLKSKLIVVLSEPERQKAEKLHKMTESELNVKYHDSLSRQQITAICEINNNCELHDDFFILFIEIMVNEAIIPSNVLVLDLDIFRLVCSKKHQSNADIELKRWFENCGILSQAEQDRVKTILVPVHYARHYAMYVLKVGPNVIDIRLVNSCKTVKPSQTDKKGAFFYFFI